VTPWSRCPTLTNRHGRNQTLLSSVRTRLRRSLLRPLMATAYRDRGPQAHHPTGSPATEARIPHWRPASHDHGLEAIPVATVQPADGELAAALAERHAPAAARISLTLEQSRKISQVVRPHGPSVDICAHQPEATPTAAQVVIGGCILGCGDGLRLAEPSITWVSALELGKYNIRLNSVNPTGASLPIDGGYTCR
jgi:hypothetical protein